MLNRMIIFVKNTSGAGGESAPWGLLDAQSTLSAVLADRVMVFFTNKLLVVDQRPGYKFPNMLSNDDWNGQIIIPDAPMLRDKSRAACKSRASCAGVWVASAPSVTKPISVMTIGLPSPNAWISLIERYKSLGKPWP